MQARLQFLPARWLCGGLAWLALGATGNAAPPLDAYGNLPQFEFARISPSAGRIAMIGVNADHRQLVIAEAGTNKLIKATAVGENKVRDLRWAGDEHLLVTVSATSPLLYDFGMERLELYGVLHVGLDAARPWSVFEHSDDIEHTVFGFDGAFAQDGHWSAYLEGLTLEQQRGFGDHGYTRQHTWLDLYRVDLETSKPTLVARGAGRDHDWVVGADGTITAHVEFAGATGDWLLYAGASRDHELMHKVTLRGQISLLGLGRRPGTVVVIDRSGATDVMSEIDVKTGNAETLLAGIATHDYYFDPLTGLLIGAATAEDPWASFFDPALQKHYNNFRKAFARQRVRLESFTPELRDMIVFTEGTADSGTFWLVSGTTHRADPIGYAYPQVKAEDVGPVQRIEYQAADGLALDAVLTLPPGRAARDLPLVVMPHGGPIGPWDDAGFDWWAQAFASQGYAVLQPNYRGSGGHTVELRKAGYGEWGRKIPGDIADGVAALARQGTIDPKRACIVGASYGGYAALAGVTVQQGLYRCAVAVGGLSNLGSFLAWQARTHPAEDPDLREIRARIGAKDSTDAVLPGISPIHFASRADAPILLVHGKDDTRVPIEQSRDMAAALRSAGKVYDYVELPKEDHFLSHDATRIAMLKAAVAFVARYNPP